jgi:hypothetical protein
MGSKKFDAFGGMPPLAWAQYGLSTLSGDLVERSS